MRKTISLLLVLTMIFSTLFAVTVSADAVNITLSRNKTFITEVDETKSLIVTPLDENGEEGALPEGTTLTYESSRPWVLSIADDGKFIDGGYDGTTKITVKASNGMEASTIFIKNSNNAYADWSYATGDSTDHYGGDFVGSRADGSKIRYRGTWVDGKRRFNVNAEGVSEEDKATAKIPGENYYKLATTAATPNLDNTIVSGYDNLNDAAKAAKAGWYNEGLRVLQGWFYDDGVSAVHLKTYMSQSSNYLNGESHLNWETDIKAVENSDAYSVVYHHNVDEAGKVYHEIKRSKGWHQATIIMDDTKNFEMYIDGELLASAKAIYKATTNDLIAITGATAGNFDEFVVAANPNTTKPADYFDPTETLEPAESISLSRNKTFIKEVDETKSLIVTPLDKNGDQGDLPEGTTFTYESTRPWVLSIADDGKFIDGGYDGTTKVTVTASNGMKASAIFIKNTDNIYADTSYATGDATDNYSIAEGVGVGLRYRGTYIVSSNYNGRFNVNAAGVSEEDKAAAKIPGENYLKMKTAESNPNPDTAIITGYDSVKNDAITNLQGWYKEGLRVMQGWFYDDGESAVHMRSFMTQHAEYLPGFNHISWKTDIKADAGADAYSVVYINAVKDNKEYTIKRSKGWHQATIILNEDLSTDVFIDGELLSTSTYNNNTDYAHSFWIAAASEGNFDEFVVATNPNTEMPAGFLERTIEASIHGHANVGQTLTATPVVKDEYGPITGETYQWQKLVGDTWTDIVNATASTYTIIDDDLGSKLRVVIKPLNGAAAESNATDTVTEAIESVPVVKGLTVSGKYEAGETLKVDYTYEDSALGDGTDNSIIIFEVSSTTDGQYTPVQSSVSKEYMISSAVINQYLRIRVIPKDNTGIAGEEVRIDPVKVGGTATFFVAQNGSDSNPGTIDAPFATIEKARNTIRAMSEKPEGGIVVNIRGGIYPVSETISFTKDDSGTEDSPITYQAYNGERVSFIGGKSLDSSKIEKVTDKALLDRLVEEDAKEHLYMLDLKAQGVEMDPLAPWGWQYSNDKTTKVYMNNNLLTEARWPNDDQAQNLVDCRPLTAAKDGIDEDKINTVRTPIMYEYPDPENRSEKWTVKKGDAYIGGAIVYFWAITSLRIDNIDTKKKIVTSLDTSYYGPVKGVGWGPQYSVYFSNIFEEIDKPGESYVDREKGILYFYPTDDVKGAELSVSTLKKNMISLNEVSYVSFKGIDFQNTVETPVVMNNCANISFEDGEISNTSANGIKINGGKDILVTGCNIYTTSISAITVDKSGNRKTLEPSGVVIENNNFHNTGISPNNAAGAAIMIHTCFDVRIRNNEFNDMKFGVLNITNSNDIIFEYNDVLNVGQLTSDAGAIYWGREGDTLGNTVRYNYFENIGSTLVSNYLGAHQSTSFFVDDASTGGNVYGNVFFNGGSNTNGSGAATTGNGPEFSNLWGNVAIATDYDKMNRAYMMRNWADTDGMGNLYGVKVPAGTAASSWLSINHMRSPYDGKAAEDISKADRELMWSDAWIKHYQGTQWEAALKHYGKDIYDGAKALFDKKDYAGLLTYLGENLTHERTNKIHDNVALGATIMDSLADHYNNYLGTQHQITEEDKALFVDFDNKDFTLTKEGLAKIQKVAPEFKEIPFNQIGMKSDVGGAKPVVTVNPELVTGVAAPGSKITTSYTFTDGDGDAEGGTKVYWWVCDTANGKFEKLWGYEGKDFKVTDDYAGRYLKYEVVPYDVTQMRGVTVMSDPIEIRKAGAADISELSAIIAEAEALLKDSAVGEEPGQYPQNAVDAFRAVIDKAIELVNDLEALQYQVNAAEQELTEAIIQFKSSKISSLDGIEVERVSLNTLLKDKENWKNYDKGTLTFNEDGSLTFGNEDFTMLGYEGKKFKNAEFSFKMKAEISNPDVEAPQNAWIGIYLRNSDPSDKVWTESRQGFMVDLKQNLIQLQEYPTPAGIYQDSILNDKNFVPGKEYDMTVGLYDVPDSNDLLFVMTMDGETIYSKKFEDQGLYGKENYLAFSVGNIKLTLSPFYADTAKLDSVIADADEFAETAVAGDGYGEYPEEAVKAFEEALAQAKKIAANEDAVQSEVEKAALEVQKALNALKASSSGVGTVKADGEVAINYNHEIADITVDKAVKDLTVKIDTKQPQPEIKITSEDVELTIPAFTDISDDFKAPLLNDTTPSVYIIGSNYKVYGKGSTPVKIDGLARIVLKKQDGRKVASYINEKGKATGIIKTIPEDSFEVAAATLEGKNYNAVRYVSGDDIIIYTNLLTEFISYYPEQPPLTPSPTPDTEVQGPITGGQTISVGGLGGGGTTTQKEDKPSGTSRFTDIIGHWAENDIKAMFDKGIVSGVTATTFEPDRSITRAEFAALMARALGLTASNDDAVFADVENDAWYKDAVSAAAAAGLIVGYDGNFRPNDTITREEMAVVIMKAYKFLGKSPLNGKLSQFDDKASISEWAVDYVDGAVSSGLISGMTESTFAPKENATRAQVASLIKRLLNK